MAAASGKDILLTCHLSLCGIKHAGKTSAGIALSYLLKCRFADTDDLLQKSYNRKNGTDLTVREIYQTLGEEGFRRLEAETVRAVGSMDPMILALGGGTLSNPFLTQQDVKGLGFICCLDTDDRTAFERILRKGLPPFLLQEKDPFAAFCESNRIRREVFREKAHAVIPAEPSPHAAARKIYKVFLNWRKQQSNEANHE